MSESLGLLENQIKTLDSNIKFKKLMLEALKGIWGRLDKLEETKKKEVK